MNPINQINPYLQNLDTTIVEAFESKKILVDPEITSLDMTRQEHARGNSELLWTPPNMRTFLQPAFEDIMRNVCEQCDLIRATHIVEVGCGILNSQGKSHVSSLMPDSIARKFTYTDLNSSANSCKSENFIAADLTQLSKSIKLNHFDAVIASCALDTIHANALSSTIKEIAKVLAPTGFFISISDQYPYLNTILDHYSKQGMILFPLVNEEKNVEGLQVITPEELNSFMQKSSLSSDEKNFFEWYRKLSSGRRELILTQICLSAEREDIEISYTFSKWMAMQKIEGAQIIKNEDFYHGNLRAGLEAAGLIIKIFKRVSSSFIIPRKNTGNFNFFSLENGHSRKGRNYVLAPNHVYYFLSTNLVVAQKEILNK